MTLETHEYNTRARALYEKIGFKCRDKWPNLQNENDENDMFEGNVVYYTKKVKQDEEDTSDAKGI